jgi:hypothetical protein
MGKPGTLERQWAGQQENRNSILDRDSVLSSFPFYFFFNIKTRNYTMGKVTANNLIIKIFTLYIYFNA